MSDSRGAAVLGEGHTPGWGAHLVRHWWVPLVALVLCFTIGWQVSSAQQPTYTAGTRLVFSASKEFDPLNQSTSYDIGRFVANQANIMSSAIVVNKAIEEMKSPLTAEEFTARLTATPLKEGGAVEVSATAPTPDEAAAMVNAVTKTYSAYIRESIADLVAGLSATTNDASTLSDVRARAALYGDGLSIRETVTAPDTASGPQPLRDATFLALFGLLASLAALILWHLARPIASRPGDVAVAAGAPLLLKVKLLSDRLAANRIGETLEALTFNSLDGSAVLVVHTLGKGASVQDTCTTLSSALLSRGISSRIVQSNAVDGPRALARCRDEASVTLIPVADVQTDSRGLTLAKHGDGLLLVSYGNPSQRTLQDIRSRAVDAGARVRGVIISGPYGWFQRVTASTGQTRTEQPTAGPSEPTTRTRNQASTVSRP
ncbi:MAG: hypothetical protein ACOYBY_05325 [Dermatophilaceae bacterium]